MNVLLLSHNRILHDDKKSGATTGIYIPLRSRTKNFADIMHPNTRSVKERAGDVDDPTPLWRQDGPYVTVYGNIHEETEERRESVSIYLPQDFVTPECDAFYYVFSDTWVVHGVKSQDENGKDIWGVSLIEEQDNSVVDVVMSSVSERLVEGAAKNITVAVHQAPTVFDDLEQQLEPFGLAPVKFSKLSPQKGVQPLYHHRDYSLLMMVVALCSFAALVMSLMVLSNNFFDLERQQQEVARVKEELQKMQRKKRLGHINNPDQILNVISNGLPAAPSSILHAGAHVGSQFGQLVMVEAGNDGPRSNNRRRASATQNQDTSAFKVKVTLKMNEDVLLLDQERMALALIKRTPWLSYIERDAVNKNILEVGVNIK